MRIARVLGKSQGKPICVATRSLCVFDFCILITCIAVEFLFREQSGEIPRNFLDYETRWFND